jgi:hypothetical protein
MSLNLAAFLLITSSFGFSVAQTEGETSYQSPMLSTAY